MRQMKTTMAAVVSTAFLLAPTLITQAAVTVKPEGAPLMVNELARYDSESGEGGSEILAYDPYMGQAYVTNGAKKALDLVDFSTLASNKSKTLSPSKRIKMKDLGLKHVKDVTSVATHPHANFIAVSVVSDPKTDNGKVVFLDKQGHFLTDVTVGAQPDMLTFNEDGSKLLVANEGEPSDDYAKDPEGSVSVIDLSHGPMEAEVTDVPLKDAPIDQGVRLNSKGSIAQQLEPEYITVQGDTAYVSLQENNAIAKLNLKTNNVDHIYAMGTKDHSLPQNTLDVKKDGKANPETMPLLGLYQPDGIEAAQIGDRSYIVTANEGDTRDYEGYSEESKIKDLKEKIGLKATNYKGFSQSQLDKMIGNGLLDEIGDVKVSKEEGQKNGTYEALYTNGGRSFSILDANTMKQVYDSGGDFERKTADLLPDVFNADSTNLTVDDRSNAKGPEPENVQVGKVGDRTYAFIGLERLSGIMVYDVTNPKAPTFAQLITGRDFSENVKGDVSPEGLKFVEAKQSPTGHPLLFATHEISGTVAVYEFQKATPEKHVNAAKEKVSSAIIHNPHTAQRAMQKQP